MNLSVHMIDVFGSGDLTGNPLAVVLGADELEPEEMQRLARWFNLSETAFLLPATNPEADYRVRIFTLEREMPFAGHPTLGACHTWLTTGHTPKSNNAIVQECGAGLVRLRSTADGRLSFAAPPLIRSGPPSRDELSEALRFLELQTNDIVDAAWIDNGPGWLGIRLGSAEAVLRLEPQRSSLRRIDIGVIGPYKPGGDFAFEVRAFFSDHLGTIVEDPVTGSLNAAFAQWLLSTGAANAPYTATQGKRVGRDGRIDVNVDDAGDVWVGGQTRSHVTGRLHIDHSTSLT
jgi:PhzF family phenazine biosynthesis protein